MPRRPRPASRNPPRSATTQAKKIPTTLLENALKEDVEDLSSDEETGDEENADVPRVAQWVDEDDLVDEQSDDSSEEGPSKKANLNALDRDLSGLSMGALRRAQQALSRTQDTDSEDSDDDDSEENETEEAAATTAMREKEWSLKPRPDIGRRQNKHAPIEVSSKKPVTRRRTVVQTQTSQARDPRFLPMTGEFSSDKFRQNYDFLTESHKTELQTLRENLKRARKMLSSSSRDLRPEREAEIQRLELAVKRAESTVNKDRREEIEERALKRVSKEERNKREAGKGNWYLKNSAKKELLVKARYDALAENGGQSAVKKAIDKKRKKISQKEKKSRPFANRERHSLDSGDGGGPSKRRKIW
ncbi:DUF947-domain-containing protein [Dendrothele bispora CBS 962.96]|uniref:rRNA biogenesis protein RRP36 n=1 Tax=Dendrothele bispora (strain CBS 962.96) TaxID=1314807 RepID=A0A4S8MWL5_DENBC|nr:DUF947-domain-containing protein [Dendrothele bispora CBS 962.96]